MLDEHKASSAAIIAVDGALLFVNTATGRFLSRTLPLLRDPGHAFVTGSLIRFAVPLPSEPRLTADVVGPSPALVLVSVGVLCGTPERVFLNREEPPRLSCKQAAPDYCRRWQMCCCRQP
jgi:hypothetical protein